MVDPVGERILFEFHPTYSGAHEPSLAENGFIKLNVMLSLKLQAE
jgi:hypothetical protein